MSTSRANLLPLIAAQSPLAGSLPSVWDEVSGALAARLGIAKEGLTAYPTDALKTLRAWATANPESEAARQAIHGWLVHLRQDNAIEGVLQTLASLDRALRRSAWRVGLAAPEWQAVSELLSDFFEAVYAEATASWQGLHGQNQQLREELAYFHRLAEALANGRELDEHLQLAVRETARLLQCEFCAVLLPKADERDVLAIAAATAPKILTRALAGMAFPLAENGLIAQVFMTGAPASTYRPLDDLEITLRRRQTLESLGFSQLLAYPLQVHGRVMGVLCLANRLDDQPWQAVEEEWLSTVAGQLAASIRLSQLFGRAELGERDLVATLEAVMAHRDPHLRDHGRAVGALARELGAMLGLETSQLETLELAGCLHDLGQIFWPDSVRLRPGPLWAEDLRWLMRHPADGAELLGELRTLEGLAAAVRHHHERWDGAGYPDGLRGATIPLEARILAVAETYVTLITPQSYQRQLAPVEALAEVRACAGSQFDALVVQALLQVRGQGDAAEIDVVMPVAGHFSAQEMLSGGRPVPKLSAVAPHLSALLNALDRAEDDAAFLAVFWRSLASEVAFDAVALWHLHAGVRLELVETHGWTDPPSHPKAPLDGLENYAAACRVPVAVGSLEHDRRFAPWSSLEGEGFVSAVAFPLVAGERTLGVLTLYRRSLSPFTGAEQAVADLAAGLLAHGMAQSAWRAVQAQGIDADPLTGLANARRFGDRLGAELLRVGRFDLPVAMCLVDLNDFDVHVTANGFALADEALLQVVELIREVLRPGDLLARLYGDRFAVLMPEVTAMEAEGTAEAIRRQVAEARYPGRQAGGSRLMARVGLVTHRGAGLSRKQAMVALTRALDAAGGADSAVTATQPTLVALESEIEQVLSGAIPADTPFPSVIAEVASHEPPSVELPKLTPLPKPTEAAKPARRRSPPKK